MRTKMSVAIAALVCQSCIHTQNATTPSSQETEATCGTTNNAPELVTRGNSHRNEGLQSLRESRLESGWIATKFRRAIECYSRALLIAPDSYDAKLGLGVTYLGLAQTEKELSPRSATLLAAAKRSLGEAYVARWGFHEPLYYLGEVAVLERQYDLARRFFAPLLSAGYKRGPVNVALGYMAEREQGLLAAKPYYEAALLAGWPADSVTYAKERLESKRW